jgi:hypothetical protein
MVLVKANKESEAGVLPDTKILAEMGKFNEELVTAGVMLAGEGLQPSSKGARVRFQGTKRTVIDGPFTESKELIAGFVVGSGDARGSGVLSPSFPERPAASPEGHPGSERCAAAVAR